MTAVGTGTTFIEKMMEEAIRTNASDLIITQDAFPVCAGQGQMHKTTIFGKPSQSDLIAEMETLFGFKINPNKAEMKDFAYSSGPDCRFRGNIRVEKGRPLTLLLRAIPSSIPPLDTRSMPQLDLFEMEPPEPLIGVTNFITDIFDNLDAHGYGGVTFYPGHTPIGYVKDKNGSPMEDYDLVDGEELVEDLAALGIIVKDWSETEYQYVSGDPGVGTINFKVITAMKDGVPIAYFSKADKP